MGDLLQPTHLMVIGILLLVLFGAKRLPELGKGLGAGLKGFKNGFKGTSGRIATVACTGTHADRGELDPGRSQIARAVSFPSHSPRLSDADRDAL
jgi:sec-independent protein translocase protein TatA